VTSMNKDGKTRQELLHDASTILSELNSKDGKLTEKDVQFLTDCYKVKACSADVMTVLLKYDRNLDGRLDFDELVPILDSARVVADIQKVMEVYDTNHDGKLSPEEMKVLVSDYEAKRADPQIMSSLSRWDADHDGKLDEKELQVLLTDIKSTDSNLRYTGYTFMVPTIFRHAIRYSAYVSDFGESFRPIINFRLVRFTYAISWSYVIGDVIWEGYKSVQKKRPSEKSGRSSCRTCNFSILGLYVDSDVCHSFSGGTLFTDYRRNTECET